eukprot:m.174554 g.174554  ORF g.174554 m.174554 type:complete len:452 (-) comp13847_c0_seq1:300-1655(-)
MAHQRPPPASLYPSLSSFPPPETSMSERPERSFQDLADQPGPVHARLIAASAASPARNPSLDSMQRPYLPTGPYSAASTDRPVEVEKEEEDEDGSSSPPAARQTSWGSRFKTYIHNAIQAPMFKPRFSPDAPIWLLGDLYGAPAPGEAAEGEAMPSADDGHLADLMHDIDSRLWFSYREGFPEIAGTTQTSDMGWGCMLRSGQMMLAQVILNCTVGRGFRRDMCDQEVYRNILHLFYDKPDCPFSVHNLLKVAADYGVRPGTWLGPNSVCLAIGAAVRASARHLPPCLGLATRLTAYVATDCLVSRAELEAATRSHDGGEQRPVFIMIPLRLGVNTKLNKLYVSGLQNLFSHRECVGVVGGKPRHSMYFIGFQEDEMIALDPHLCQRVVDPGSPSTSTASYHTSTPRKIKFTSADPSLAIGFLCRNAAEIQRFYELSLTQNRTSPLYSIGP